MPRKKKMFKELHERWKELDLPEEQKEVLYMRCYAGMSIKDIAEQTDVSINTALGRMRYAIINIRKIVEEKKVILTA